MSKIMQFLTIFWCMQWAMGAVDIFIDDDRSNEFDRMIQCDEIKFCSKDLKPFKDAKPNRFKTMRETALKITQLQENSIIGIRNSSNYIELIEAQYRTCMDDTTGFLLDENVEDYKISCVWTGGIQIGRCVAVPEKYTKSPYFYIEGSEWTKKVNAVRQALGCENWIPIEPNDFELFICNERCIQGGVGFLASILILVVLTFSFCKNCA